MNLGGLLALYRSTTGDSAEPYRCSDDEVINFANDAVNEACRRARLITDSSTPACCELSFLLNVASMALHSSVIYVRDVLLSDGSRLAKVRRADMDAQLPGWRPQTGTPEIWVPDFSTGFLRLYPTPDTATTVSMTVVRIPLADMSIDSDEPEIHPRYHRALLHWMLYRTYTKPDPDIYSKDSAAIALAEFEREFGPAESAVEETWIHERHGYDADEGLR